MIALIQVEYVESDLTVEQIGIKYDRSPSCICRVAGRLAHAQRAPEPHAARGGGIGQCAIHHTCSTPRHGISVGSAADIGTRHVAHPLGFQERALTQAGTDASFGPLGDIIALTAMRAVSSIKSLLNAV